MSGGVVLHSVFLNSIFPCLLENLPPFIPDKAWIMPGLMQIPGLVQQQRPGFCAFPHGNHGKDAVNSLVFGVAFVQYAEVVQRLAV